MNSNGHEQVHWMKEESPSFKAGSVNLTHETVRDWEERFVPAIAAELGVKRYGQVGRSWYGDETDIEVHGK